MLKINSHLDSKIVALGDGMETKLIMQALKALTSLGIYQGIGIGNLLAGGRN